MKNTSSAEATKSWLGLGAAAVLLVVAALSTHGQIAAAQADGTVAERAQIFVSGGGPSTAMLQAPAQAVREIDDPCTGARWLLMRDAGRPGGPGRLALVPNVRDDGGWSGKREDLLPNAAASAKARLGPVIRAGDRLIVEENTAVVEARLEAQALGPAVSGSTFRARLEIGGKVVQVVALGTGRAVLVPEAEVRP